MGCLQRHMSSSLIFLSHLAIRCHQRSSCGLPARVHVLLILSVCLIISFFTSAPPLARPVETMEKLGDEWTSNSVTSTFRVKHKYGRPIGCVYASDRVYTQNCGLGWRFAVAHDDEPPEFDIYFDPYVSNVALKELTVSVKLGDVQSTRSATSFVLKAEATYSLPCPGPKRIVSWLPLYIDKYPLLTFVVTFTSVDLNLPSPKGDSTVNKALSNSLRTGAFIDTRIFVFSRRLSPDRVGHPLPVFANSSILKAKSSDLYDRLCFHFHLVPRQLLLITYCTELSEDFTSYEGIGVDEYGYESDSDLDDLDAEEAMRSMSMSSSESCEGNEVSSCAYLTFRIITLVIYAGSHSDIQGQSPNEPVHFQSIGKTFLIKNFAFTTYVYPSQPSMPILMKSLFVGGRLSSTTRTPVK
jgi:hypothetical protein